MPLLWWNSSSIIAICCELLQKLSNWLKRRHCPNYFIPEANLFHEPSSSTMLDKTERRLNEFHDCKILCNWFVENYIHQFIWTHFKVGNIWKVGLLPHFVDYMMPLFEIRKRSELQSLDAFFLHGFQYCNTENEGLRLISKFQLFMHNRYFAMSIPANVWCFTYLDSTVYCLKVAHGLGSGHISWENEVFVELFKELYLQPKIVRCQYHRYPEPITTGTQFQCIRAITFLEHLSGSESRSEFRLVSLMSKMFLRNALITAFVYDDSQSSIIVPAALVYLAALHFTASEYKIVIDLCSSVLQDHELFFFCETLNAGCLFFIDDVVTIVGFCLLCKKFSENMNFNMRQIYLDLRLTPKVFAYYLIVMSSERMSKQLEVNLNLTTPSFPLDQLLICSTKRKFCISMQSSTCFKAVRQCVYRSTVLLTANTTFSVNHSRIEEEITDALLEYALEKLTSFYSVIGIKCNTADCYRALYLYNCRQYDEVLHLCEGILHQPDLQDDLNQFAFTNVLLLPPLDTFFDTDAQCLLGLHTLFYYLSPLNDDLRKCELTTKSTFAHLFSRFVYSEKDPLTTPLFWPYPINCHYSLGVHFLARYLKLRCLIDCEQPWAEALAEFAAMKSNHPFEHIIRRFVLQKFRKSRSNPRFLSRR